MLWKPDSSVLDDRCDRPSVSDEAPAPDTAFPTPGAVFGEMAVTLAVFLVFALVMHLVFGPAGG